LLGRPSFLRYRPLFHLSFWEKKKKGEGEGKKKREGEGAPTPTSFCFRSQVGKKGKGGGGERGGRGKRMKLDVVGQVPSQVPSTPFPSPYLLSQEKKKKRRGGEREKKRRRECWECPRQARDPRHAHRRPIFLLQRKEKKKEKGGGKGAGARKWTLSHVLFHTPKRPPAHLSKKGEREGGGGEKKRKGNRQRAISVART